MHTNVPDLIVYFRDFILIAAGSYYQNHLFFYFFFLFLFGERKTNLPIAHRTRASPSVRIIPLTDNS